jgi:uncharacterized membrane protein (UPF0127 family)
MDNGTVTIGNKVWNVQIASSPADIQQGFSGVTGTPFQTGILFNLGLPYTGLTINMHLMLFPLDIAFIDSNGRVVDIALGVKPLHDYVSNSTYSSFMEVNAGELADLRIGDNVTTSNSRSLTAGINFNIIIQAMLVIMIMKMMMGAVK